MTANEPMHDQEHHRSRDEHGDGSDNRGRGGHAGSKCQREGESIYCVYRIEQRKQSRIVWRAGEQKAQREKRCGCREDGKAVSTPKCNTTG
ncbi:hypothetical protein [Oryzisolibacter sp. LB2S]|uniref:hypothetical protein n=1 Tax=Alicycliphilus soli TaxID=3228789 RepID=UPI00345B074F